LLLFGIPFLGRRLLATALCCFIILLGEKHLTDEYKILAKDLDDAFFRYAHITGSLECYMTIIENIELQKSFSKILSGAETEWKVIHRFMIVDGENIKWYPELPATTILDQRNTLLGYIYGITLSRLIGDLDFYLGSVLQKHFGHSEISGNSWNVFIQKTKFDLMKCRNGEFVFTILQERHKIEHNKAQIDRVFLNRMDKQGVKHTFKEGDSIQKSHMDVLLTHQAIREFSEDVDTEILKLINK